MMTPEQKLHIRTHLLRHGHLHSTRHGHERPPCVACRRSALPDSRFCFSCQHAIDLADDASESLRALRQDMALNDLGVAPYIRVDEVPDTISVDMALAAL